MNPEGSPASSDAPDAEGLGAFATRLAAMLGAQIAALEAEPFDGSFSENRVKALLALTKALQAMEETANRLEKAADERRGDAEDIMAFRQRLARQIAALEDERAGEPVPGGAEQ